MTNVQRIKNLLRYPSLTVLSQDMTVMERAQTLVKYYYLVIPFLAFLFGEQWAIPLTEQNFSPLWPLAWAHYFSLNIDTTIVVIRLFFLAASLLCVSLYRYRIMRIFLFLAIWQAHAFMSSFGTLNHQWYPWVYTSFILIFLPDIQNAVGGVAKKREYLLVIWWAQASLMLIYTMAGFWKFEVALQQFFWGQINGFSEHAFAYQIANWLPQLQHEALFGPFIITHPAVGWPFYVASHFFQLFALWTMIRPSLQKVWAYELVLFHIGVYLTMGIDFSPFILLLLVLFFNSPFTPPNRTLRTIIFDLPVIGQILEWITRRPKAGVQA